jgi:FtsP/CotA-like multicopper oxidase with cupredoxin domain
VFENLLNADIQAALLNVLAWTVTAILLARRPVERSPRRTRVRAIVLLALLTLAYLMVCFRIITVILMGRYGYIFAADRVAVALPALVIPAAAAGIWTVPAILRWIRRPEPASRLAAFAPRSVLPPVVAAAGALVGFWTALFTVLAAPLLLPAVLVDAGLIAYAAVLWLGQSRRFARAGSGVVRRRSLPLALARSVGVVVVVVALIAGGTAWASAASRLPGEMQMSAPAGAHDHTAAGNTRMAGSAQPISVPDLTGPRTEVPDVKVTLTARPMTVKLASGRSIDVWAFNNQIPGPTIRVRQGQLLEVTVINELAGANLAVHWHGMSVPNAEDGVAGVTQDAILPGGRYVYRFRAEDVGTHWYHSHQQTSVQVTKGLFGALIVDPPDETKVDHDWFLAIHSWEVGDEKIPAFGLSDVLEHRQAAPGERVRLRLLDSDRLTHAFSLTGTPFTVTAIDGNPLHGVTPLTGQRLVIGAGGRYDIEFVMPDHPVRLTEISDFVGALDRGIVISPDGTGDSTPEVPTRDFEPTTYGTPASTPFGPKSKFNRSYSMILDNELGFYDGRFTFKWTMNGTVFPDGPHLVVSNGDLVKLTLANRSHFDHPMHLHGHRVLVLSHNGHPVTGSPIWLDTVNVRVGDVWEVAFLADNPGIWMDHCHIGDHAALGMMTHLSYENVTTPYRVGPDTPNRVE